MLSQNPDITKLIEQTDYLFDSGIDSTMPSDGAKLLDKWIEALDTHGNEATDAIGDTLEELKAVLQGMPDAGQLKQLFQQLIDQTQKVMDSPEASAQQVELERLLATLHSLQQHVG